MSEPIIRNASGDIQGSTLLGEIFIEDGKIYKIVENGEASTAIAAGDVLVYESAADNTVNISSAASQKNVAGIAVDAIAAGAYGRMLIFGYMTGVKVDGGTTDVGKYAVLGSGGAAGYAYVTSTQGAALGICMDTVTAKTTTGTKVFVKTLGL